MAKSYALGLISALAASASSSLSSQTHVAYADGPFKLSPFSSSPSPSSGQSQPSNPPASAASSEPSSSSPPKVRNDNPRTTSAGFDPEALERGAKALKEITTSSHAKKVGFFEIGFHLLLFFLFGFVDGLSFFMHSYGICGFVQFLQMDFV
jgi:ATPase family AAA domain-containing protein 3A/B